MADAGYNINPSIADATSSTPTQTVNAGTTIVFSSPGTNASQSNSQTVTPSTTATATATAAGGNAQGPAQVASGSGTGDAGALSDTSLSILDYVLIGVGAFLAVLIVKKIHH